MAAPPPPPPPFKGGLSLYDNLHDPNEPSSSATISSAPVRYNQDGSAASEAASKKQFNPAFQFQPIRRPQAKQSKPKQTFPKAIPKASPATALSDGVTSSISATATPSTAKPSTSDTQKSRLADWAATEEDEWRFGTAEKRQRGGRKKKKKNDVQQVETDWDDIYDPSRPTNVEEYLRSDEKVDEVREWRALLYRHRRRKEHSDLSSDEEEDETARPTNQFAPPPSYGAVPPPPVSPPAPPPDDESGDDAYARRLAMSTQVPDTTQPAPPIPPPSPPPPPPPEESPLPPPSVTSSATISRAPVRYNQATETVPKDQGLDHDQWDDEDESYSPPPTLGGDDASVEAESTSDSRTKRPGQAGFAQRLMSKYGWTKGTGLGASESGIVNPLRVQVEKRRKKADADGGGWAEPGGKGKIIGGKRKEEASKFGRMSEVIVLRNMLENMQDLQAEIADGLGQEIGEECGEKYGRVERLYIDQVSRQVFIRFTDQISALRAVNELEGRVFNGNSILPRFYDLESFEKGIYST